jgi:3-deoxy-D-manno-octulosonate 8-phosphate phosphatase (KDO 8-P phosphatase)
LALIKLVILDVDGVMTTGELPYDPHGQSVKSFFVHDGAAIRLWQRTGGGVAVISGRHSPAVSRRAEELDIRPVMQGVVDKLAAYESVCREWAVCDEAVSFVGDDLPDVAPMRRCAYPIAVANAAPAVKRAARYVTHRTGGAGAVCEAVERLMRHNGAWSSTLNDVLGGA